MTGAGARMASPPSPGYSSPRSTAQAEAMSTAASGRMTVSAGMNAAGRSTMACVSPATLKVGY
jgi:hypothetical protein